MALTEVELAMVSDTIKTYVAPEDVDAIAQRGMCFLIGVEHTGAFACVTINGFASDAFTASWGLEDFPDSHIIALNRDGDAVEIPLDA